MTAIYNWNIAESSAKHNNPNPNYLSYNYAGIIKRQLRIRNESVAKQTAIVRTKTADIPIEANRVTIAYINLKIVYW